MSTPYPQLLLFGDSITQHAFSPSGFAASLAHTYSRRLDVVNRGLSGYNTSQALRLLKSTSIIPPDTQLMTIFFGANDACLPGTDQHVPLEDFAQNLEEIIVYAKERVTRVVVIAPPPICEYKTQLRDKEKGRTEVQRLASVTKQYADVTAKVASVTGVPCLLLWNTFMRLFGWKEGDNYEHDPLVGDKKVAQSDVLGELLHDGLHLSPKGYEFLFDALMQLILDKWPELDPETMPMVFPPFEVADWLESNT